MSYAELEVTSNFTFLQGASHPEEYIMRAHTLGYKAIAISDHNSLAGIVRAHTKAKELDIQFIVGTRIIFQEDILQSKNTNGFSLLLYPTSLDSYKTLSSLLTLGKLRAPKGMCYLSVKDLPDYINGMIGIISITNIHQHQLQHKLLTLKNIFPKEQLFISLSLNYSNNQHHKTATILHLSKTLSLPLVATNQVLYHLPERKILHDILQCIRCGCSIKQAGLLLPANREHFLKAPEEITRLFRHFPQAIDNTLQIAQKTSHFCLSQLVYNYPNDIHPKIQQPLDYLKALTEKGAKMRYPQGISPKVRKQLKHELKLIEELDYAKYFLTVYDIVAFAQKKGILCQGRGAAANSTVCYLLGITSVNPENIDLLVERFISKERNEPPDIDIDFEHQRREEVIQYIYSKYGRLHAALVAEVITFRRRSAVREIGKVLEFSEDTIKALQHLLSLAREETLTAKHFHACGLNPESPVIKQALSLIHTIKGFPRHLSQHVGGFIVSGTRLSEVVPIENASMPNRSVIEWDKDDINALGMLKIDILALGMLTAIRKSMSLVNDHFTNTPHGKKLTLYNIPHEDQKVYQMISKADTTGVFQIESRAQMSMLPRLRPRTFYDLVIEVAIIRPGPIQGGMIHPYLKRRQGKEVVSFPDAAIRKILGRTLGVPIFQEQVMELAVAGAGLSLGEADELRRAMSSWKRHKNLLAEFGERLIKGFLSKGYSKTFATQIKQQIKGFAEYGFPQSHAAAFAQLVYVSAWLKCHYPATFTAALLNSQPMGFYQPAQLIQDAKNHGVTVLPADVNYSLWDCSLEGDHPQLRLGLRMIKGIKQKEAEKLIDARSILEPKSRKQQPPWQSIKSLWRKTGISIATLRALARADAFSSMGISRQPALWQIKKFKEQSLPLLELIKEKEQPQTLPQVAKELEVLIDYQTLQCSLKAHPLSFVRHILSKRKFITLSELNNTTKNNQLISTGGLVLVRQRPHTASGVCFITLEDETAISNLIIWPKIFKRYRNQLTNNAILLVKGKVQKVDNITHLIVSQAQNLTLPIQNINFPARNFC